MKYLALIGLIFIVTTSLDCTSGKTYVKFKKQNKNYADEESFILKSGSTALYTSPMLADNQMFEVEQCVTTSQNDQYTLELLDEYGDGWSGGAYIMVLGEYGNVFFKTMELDNNKETYSLSLYYAIKKNQEWKMTTGATGTWTQASYPESGWTPVTLGGTIPQATGTQYFRKSFAGIASMAAYEAMFNYQCGIVVYINGVEIFRDNMNEGTPAASTAASGCYAAIGYHGIVRPGIEVNASASVLAVEIHYTDVSTSNDVNFDTYVALNAPSLINTNCMIFDDGMTYSVSPFHSTPGDMFDFNYNSFVFVDTTTFTIDLSFTKAIPYVNGLRFWPYNQVNYAPADFTFGGKNTGTTYNNIMTVTDLVHTNSQNTIVYGYFFSNLYKDYRLAITGAVSASDLYLYEIHPLICGQGAPTSITFEPASISVLAGYDIISVVPTLSEFTACTINPALPEGLTLDATTCSISGFAKSASPLVTYTVTATVGTNQYIGTIPMEFVGCAGQVIDLYRTYRENAAYEYFEVIDDATQQIVYSEAAGSSVISNVHHFVCMTGNKYTVNLHSTTTWWKTLSWLYVRGMFLFVAKTSSQNQYENIIRAKFDSDLGLPSSYTFYAPYAIPHSQNWHYKMNDIPPNWYSSDMSGFEEKPASGYPAATSQIQLYKKTFTVSSLTGAAVVLNIRYMYGCVVYLNNREVFRNGVSGTLSTNSFSTNSYTELRYHQVSLPIKTFAKEGSPSVDYITTGTNTIAIALVAATSTQTESSFDCALRVMGHNVQSRYLNDFSITGSGISGSSVGYFAFWTYSNSYYASTCNSNYINVKFSYDRREWISSLGVQLYYTQTEDYIRQFTLKARNPEDGTNWTTIKVISGMTWSQPGQLRKIYLANNKPYNEYRFENLGTGNAANCAWKLGRIDIMSDAYITVPDLAYEHTSFSIYKDVEMAEEYVTGEYYTDFTVNPPLPNGITIDPYSGTISGTASAEASTQTYTVSAKKFTGETTTTSVTITVEVCTSGRSLITLVARTDAYPEQSSYKLYQGKGTTGTVVSSIDSFSTANALNYADFCLNHEIYTLELKDTTSGWSNPAGFYLSVDIGTMKIEMGQVPSTSFTTTFSSYLPFQFEYDDWKVYKDTADVASNWNAVDFDDAAWNVLKLQNIGNSEAITVYARRTFTIPSLDDYAVLNVQIKYAGGIVAYFNGRKVARFNLIEHFNSMTESISIHNTYVYSKFHVILNTVGATTTKNVMSFEIHRPLGQSSSEAVFFDATGVFGVNECSIVVDSYSTITGSTPSGSVTLQDFFDLTPVTFGYLPNSVGSYMEWTVENLEGSKFNSYAWQTVYSYTGWGLSLYGRINTEDEYLSTMEEKQQTTLDRGRLAWDVPVGIAGFRQYRYETDATSTSTITFSAHFFQYCKPTGSGVCPGVDDYPPVGQGQISPAACEYGYTGYSYRECNGSTLGEIKTDQCQYKAPSDLAYPNVRYIFVMDVENDSGVPTFNNLITKFRLHDGTSLPSGLTLDEKTGAIRGKPTEEVSVKAYTIYGENPKGATSVTIAISVRKGECMAEGNFQKVNVGETAVYDCALQGSYIGSQKRTCVLGAKDGEWQEVQGVCMSTTLIVILVVVVIVIVIVIVLFIRKATNKNKPVGGVKGKKVAGKPVAKKTMEKKNAKAVKV